MAGGADVTRAVPEAVAIEAYRSGAITPAQVQEMLGLGSRWETESFLHRAKAYHDYTMDDLDRDIAAIRAATLKRVRVDASCSDGDDATVWPPAQLDRGDGRGKIMKGPIAESIRRS